MMSHSTPFQSFLGGLSIPIPVHALLLLNGSVLGVSGFVHRAMKGNPEALSGAVGLILGGVFVAMLENTSLPPPLLPLPKVLLSGFLVGFGTKLSNGCTSGHMISGLSRFSLRSLVATGTFFYYRRCHDICFSSRLASNKHYRLVSWSHRFKITCISGRTSRFICSFVQPLPC